MAFEIRWYSQRGSRTADNRDCAGVGIRRDSILAIVLDGSTSGLASGAFAREIARRMVDGFVVGRADVTAESLTEQLLMTHAALSEEFRAESASYVLLHTHPAEPALCCMRAIASSVVVTRMVIPSGCCNHIRSRMLWRRSRSVSWRRQMRDMSLRGVSVRSVSSRRIRVRSSWTIGR